MAEQIYTIPVNEAFEACMTEDFTNGGAGCPFCTLHAKLEEIELDRILGASMMEPDIRIQTNQKGFCSRHFEKMLTRKNRLGLALMLESHLNELRTRVEDSALSLRGAGAKASERIGQLNETCYICDRMEHAFSAMVETAALLFDRDKEFRRKLEKQPYLCLPHYRRLLLAGKKLLPKKQSAALTAAAEAVVLRYFDSLRADVSHFCKKFDYRYEDEPWGTAKDAPERAIAFLKSR